MSRLLYARLATWASPRLASAWRLWRDLATTAPTPDFQAEAAKNATVAQQQCNVMIAASTTMGIASLYSVDTATLGEASREELDKAIGKAKASRTPGNP